MVHIIRISSRRRIQTSSTKYNATSVVQTIMSRNGIYYCVALGKLTINHPIKH